MGFSSYKLLLILNIEITENFYSWGNRSACPPNLNPPKKNGDCEGKFKRAPGPTLI